MGVLTVPGARLYYEVRGAGPTLVLVPGAKGDADTYRTWPGSCHHSACPDGGVDGVWVRGGRFVRNPCGGRGGQNGWFNRW
jgi:hypothetical protein